jgi:hypothetical protein
MMMNVYTKFPQVNIDAFNIKTIHVLLPYDVINFYAVM